MKTADAMDVREALVELAVAWKRNQYRMVTLAVDLDESGEWLADGARSAAHWIADRVDVELCTARTWLRIGERLRELPVLDAAWAEGRLSYGKVRVLMGVIEPDNEAELVDLVASVRPGQVAQVIAMWRQRNETPDDTERRHQRERSFRSRVDPDGMVSISLRLPPQDAASLNAMVDAQVLRSLPKSAPTGAWPSYAQQRADAFRHLFLDSGGSGPGRVDAEVVIHVRGDGCTYDDGTPVAGTVVERIAPKAFIRTLIHDAEGRPINASGRHRHPTARQKRVVHERDRACVDCGATDFPEFDHNPPFDQSRRTLVDELCVRCPSCHHQRQPAADRYRRRRQERI